MILPKKSLKWVQKLPSATVTCPHCRHQLWVFVQWYVTDVKTYKVVEASPKRRTKLDTRTDTETDTSTDTTTDNIINSSD